MIKRINVADLDIPWVRVADGVYVGDVDGIIVDGDVPDSVLKVLIESVDGGSDESRD